MNLQSFDLILNKEDLCLFFSPEWVDSTAIRRSILGDNRIGGHLAKLGSINWDSSPPTVDGIGGISISHSKLGGTLLLSLTRKSVGVDIEELGRLSEKVLNRVSSESERAAAPNSTFLWPAKEASFKALYPDNDDISIPQMTIGNWRNLDENAWSFSSHYEQKIIKGFLFSDEIHLVAAAFV
jgi:phosphopantetheinyl transferase (holo-ACP synthase)